MPCAELHARPAAAELVPLGPWRCAAAPPGEPPADWFAAPVPGTAAGALRVAGQREPEDLDASDWWWSTELRAAPGGRLVLCLDGIATRGEITLDGAPLATFDSMWEAHRLDVTEALRDGAAPTLSVRCAALAPLVSSQRRPRARWRTRLVAQGLRFERTMLLGRAPGFAAGPAVVGPWGPVRLERRFGPELDATTLRPRLDADDGVLEVQTRWRVGAPPAGAHVELLDPDGTPCADGELGADGTATLRLAAPARWWPHTHGTPALYAARLHAGEQTWELGRVGFRTLAAGPHPDHDPVEDGLDLHLNGRRVFVRGAVWTPLDPAGDAELRATLTALRDAGLNLVRVPGTGSYERPAFHALCDELGLLVWQDAMFANLDYPVADPAFRERVVRELDAMVEAVAAHPSTVVLCGGSEIAQQITMLGLDPEALLAGGVGEELLPAAAAGAACDAVVLPDAPCGPPGGVLRADVGVANWFGVGGYLGDLGETRRAGVRFASECLALANLGDGPETAPLRDRDASWDFGDVRDHYLATLYGVDPPTLLAADPERYAALSRQVSGEVMAEVFGEWRRPASPCGGGIVLWARDLRPGAGWGLLDHAGRPKVALAHLRRVLAPTAVWTTAEGTNGVAIHAAADRGFSGRLRLALYAAFEHRIAEETAAVELAPGAAATWDADTLLGRWADTGYAYRFGPPGHDTLVASLESDAGALVAQAFRFPAGRPLVRRDAAQAGLQATASTVPGGLRVELSSRAGLWGARVTAPGLQATEDAFDVEPGRGRAVHLVGAPAGPVRLTALNLSTTVTLL